MPGYVRYVDDFALFANDRAQLEHWRSQLDRFLVGRRLSLHPRKTRLIARDEATEFLGFVLLPDGRRRLPEDNVRRFRNRLRSLRDRYRAGTVTREEVIACVNGWVGHALHANTWRLRHCVFRGGWFDPLREPDGLFGPG